VCACVCVCVCMRVCVCIRICVSFACLLRMFFFGVLIHTCLENFCVSYASVFTGLCVSDA